VKVQSGRSAIDWRDNVRLARPLTIAALLLFFHPAAAPAQSDGTPTTEQTAVLPSISQDPLASTSGRFSSINPRRPLNCRNPRVVGRVVSPQLIQLNEFGCLGQEFALQGCCALVNVLMNVELQESRDVPQMIVGRTVAIKADFKLARESHGNYLVFFLVAQNAALIAGDPPGPPAPPFTSFMVCQPPELNALARALGRELCVQSSVMATLNETGPALERAARALVQKTPADKASDDDDAITCHDDPERSDADLSTIACALRNYWSWWRMKQIQGQKFTRPAPP
jgi:hypothetical protein